MTIIDCHTYKTLYQLEPIGLGTPHKERLSGYIKRVAEANCVSVGSLMKYGILPYTEIDYIKMGHFIGKESTKLILSDSTFAQSLIKVLGDMTCLCNLYGMTLGAWSNFLDLKGTFRDYLAWCPICFEENKQAGLPVYEQLFWSFSDITKCLKHNVQLNNHCPECKSKISIFNFTSRVGYCDKCGSWLGANHYPISSDLYLTHSKDSWISENIGHLVASYPSTDEKSCLCFRNNLNLLIQDNSFSYRKLADILHVAHGTIERWLIGAKPNISSVLNISYITQTPIEKLLTTNINKISITFLDINLEKKHKKMYNKDEVRIALAKTIEEENNISLKQFAKNYGCSKDYICWNFPYEANTLVSNFEQYKKKCKQQKHDLIRNAMYYLHNEGSYPGRKAINRYFGRNMIVDEKDKDVLIRTLSELGYDASYLCNNKESTP